MVFLLLHQFLREFIRKQNFRTDWWWCGQISLSDWVRGLFWSPTHVLVLTPRGDEPRWRLLLRLLVSDGSCLRFKQNTSFSSMRLWDFLSPTQQSAAWTGICSDAAAWKASLSLWWRLDISAERRSLCWHLLPVAELDWICFGLPVRPVARNFLVEISTPVSVWLLPCESAKQRQ